MTSWRTQQTSISNVSASIRNKSIRNERFSNSIPYLLYYVSTSTHANLIKYFSLFKLYQSSQHTYTQICPYLDKNYFDSLLITLNWSSYCRTYLAIYFCIRQWINIYLALFLCTYVCTFMRTNLSFLLYLENAIKRWRVCINISIQSTYVAIFIFSIYILWCLL